MSDLTRIVDEMCAWFDGVETTPLSISAETVSTPKNQQTSDFAESFHNFQSFHAENEHSGSNDLIEVETSCFSAGGSRVTSFYAGIVESAERVERGGETPAKSTSPLFPLSSNEMERVEREGDVCERPLLDLNRAAPQRSDWWTGPAMAEADRLAPPPGDPLPISAADVRAGVAREMRSLAEDGREGSDALRDAVAITRAKIRNSEALAERQAHGGRCHVCDALLDDSAPVVAVLSWSRGGPLHLHAGCCAAYSARRVALVDRIMASAGYGAPNATGEVA